MPRLLCWLRTRHRAAGEWSAWWSSGTGPQYRTRFCPTCKTSFNQRDG